MKLSELHEYIKNGDFDQVQQYISAADNDANERKLFAKLNGKSALFLALEYLIVPISGIENSSNAQEQRMKIFCKLLVSEEVKAHLPELLKQPAKDNEFSLLQFAFYRANYLYNDQYMMKAKVYLEATSAMLQLLCPRTSLSTGSAIVDYSQQVSSALSHCIKPNNGKLKNQRVNMLHITATFGWSQAMWLILSYKPDASILTGSGLSALHIAVLALGHQQQLDTPSKKYQAVEVSIDYRHQRMDSLERLLKYVESNRTYSNTLNQTTIATWYTDYDKPVENSLASVLGRLLSSNTSTASQELQLQGETPLHSLVRCAAKDPQHYIDAIRLLLRYGANRIVQDQQGCIPYDLITKLNIQVRQYSELLDPKIPLFALDPIEHSYLSDSSINEDDDNYSEDSDQVGNHDEDEFSEDPDQVDNQDDDNQHQHSNPTQSAFSSTVADIKPQSLVTNLPYVTLPPPPEPSRYTGIYASTVVNQQAENSNSVATTSTESSSPHKQQPKALLAQIQQFNPATLKTSKAGADVAVGIVNSTKELETNAYKKYSPLVYAAMKLAEERRQRAAQAKNSTQETVKNDNNSATTSVLK